MDKFKTYIADNLAYMEMQEKERKTKALDNSAYMKMQERKRRDDNYNY